MEDLGDFDQELLRKVVANRMAASEELPIDLYGKLVLQGLRQVVGDQLDVDGMAGVQDVREVPLDFVLQLRRYFQSLHVVRDVLHLLRVLLLLLSDLLQRSSDRVHGERKHPRSNQQEEYPEKPFKGCLRRQVPVTDCVHRRHSPIQAVHVPNVPGFVLQPINCKPVLFAILELRDEMEDAAQPVRPEPRHSIINSALQNEHAQLQETHYRCDSARQLQSFFDLIEDDFEFRQSQQSEDLDEPKESQHPKQIS